MNQKGYEPPLHPLEDIHLAETMAYGERPRRALAKLALEYDMPDRAADHLQWATQQGEVAGRKHIEKIQRELWETVAVEDFGFSLKVSNMLRRRGIKTIGELMGCSEHDLMNIRNFGEKALAEVVESLTAHQLSLKNAEIV